MFSDLATCKPPQAVRSFCSPRNFDPHSMQDGIDIKGRLHMSLYFDTSLDVLTGDSTRTQALPARHAGIGRSEVQMAEECLV